MSNTNTKFDYQEITSIYNSMNNIIGEPSNPTTIAGILKFIDDEYHDLVNGTAGEDYLAIYGDLGATLLDSWENTASTFPAFIENFSAWSTVVAQAAGNYADFENQVKGIRSDNPLGWNTGGIQDSRVATSYYASASTHEELDEKAALRQFYEPVGAYYVDTGMVSAAKSSTFWNAFGDVMSVVAIVTAPFSLSAAGVFGGTTKAGVGLVDDAAGATGKALAGTADDAGGAVVKATASGADDVTGAVLNSGDDLAQTVAKTGASSSDEVASSVVKQASNGTDDMAAAGAKAARTESQVLRSMDQSGKTLAKRKEALDVATKNLDDYVKAGGDDAAELAKLTKAKTSAQTAYDKQVVRIKGLQDEYVSITQGTPGKVGTESSYKLINGEYVTTNGSVSGNVTTNQVMSGGEVRPAWTNASAKAEGQIDIREFKGLLTKEYGPVAKTAAGTTDDIASSAVKQVTNSTDDIAAAGVKSVRTESQVLRSMDQSGKTLVKRKEALDVATRNLDDYIKSGGDDAAELAKLTKTRTSAQTAYDQQVVRVKGLQDEYVSVTRGTSGKVGTESSYKLINGDYTTTNGSVSGNITTNQVMSGGEIRPAWTNASAKAEGQITGKALRSVVDSPTLPPSTPITPTAPTITPTQTSGKTIIPWQVIPDRGSEHSHDYAQDLVYETLE